MTVRFGVAGTGHWAREVHLPALAATRGVTVVGMWGRNAETVRAAANRHGIAAFSTFNDMLAAVDAVTIAVPPAVQPLLAVAAANAGKHLLLEKPLALDTKAALDVVAAVERNAVAALVFFMRRFVPEIELAVNTAAQDRWDGADVHVHSAAMSSTSPYVDSLWRQAPGAALWDIGPHVLSILLPVLGTVEHITARHHPDRRTTFETMHAGGAQALVSLTLHGDATQVIRRYRFNSASKILELPEPPFSHQEAMQRAITELLSQIDHPLQKHRADIALGLEVVRLLEAAQRNAAANAPEPVRD